MKFSKIDDSGWMQSHIIFPVVSPTNIGTNNPVGKKKRGRPSSSDSYIHITIGLRPAQWRWVSLWFLGGSPSDCVRSLLDRAMKFWPGGPSVFRGGVR